MPYSCATCGRESNYCICTGKNSIYTPAINAEDNHYVSGPGDGHGHHSETLFPDLTCKNKDEADRAAKIANTAYKEGYEASQRDMRRVIGVGKQ